MKTQPQIFARDEIYRMLATSLIKKKPLPPENWSVVKLDEEVNDAGKEYNPDLFSRHQDAFATCVFYLVDFACRMPEWINLSIENSRVQKMCGELADEIEQITYEPAEVIARHGKLKSWLKAILAVQTCWIYREETKRVIAEKEKAKILSRTKQSVRKERLETDSRMDKWQSELARSIMNKVSGKQPTENSSAQPSLF